MTDKMAKAVRTSLAVSTKQSVEIGKFIKGRSPQQAIVLLEGVTEQTVAVPYTRFNWNTGHKKGIGPGRYPQKAATEFISLIKLAIANATDIGLNVENLRIYSMVAQKASKSYRHGRHRGQKAKHTHLELVLEQVEPKAKKVKKAAPKKSDVETEEKPVEAKPVIAEKPVEKKVEAKPAAQSKPAETKAETVEDKKE